MRGEQRLLRTRRARTTLAADLKRQVKSPDGTTPTRPGRAAQEIRAQATAKSRAIKASRVASRLIARAMRIQVQTSELCDSVATYMTSELTRARVAAVNEMYRGSTRIGHLVPWLPAGAVLILDDSHDRERPGVHHRRPPARHGPAGLDRAVAP